MTVVTLNIISDLATPHNNDLIAALRKNGRIKIVTWYALRHLDTLPWKEPLGGAVDNYYFDALWVKIRLLFRALCRSNEDFLLVGYSNIPSKLILVAYWIIGRRLYYWSDHPEPTTSWGRGFGRRIAYFLLRKSVKKCFVVGKLAERYFLEAGFHREQLQNLPICIALPPLLDDDIRHKIRLRYEVAPQEVLAVAASRLVYSKGYDIVLRAVALLRTELRDRLRIVIIGSGPEEARLKELSHSLAISGKISFVPWLEHEDYERALAAAHFFIHPARFDAFGGGTLYAMGMGVPVIGSEGAGSAMERIVPGINGLLFVVDDERGLADCIERLLVDPELRGKLARAARCTAEDWTPIRGADILEKVIIREGIR